MDIVEQTLDRFTHDLQRVLGDTLLDVIVHGSYVLGDFRPNHGDLDYIVVTNGDLNEAVNATLFELHDSYRSGQSFLLHQLEGTFYPKGLLRTLALPFVGCYIGTGRRGWRTITTFQNSYIDLRIAEEHGRQLLGAVVPIYRPTEADILREQRVTLENQIATADSIEDLSIGYWMSAAHWCARTMYYRATGKVVPKSEGCRWARTVVQRDDLRELLSLAEGQRYPYEPGPVEDWMRVACRELLAHVGRLLQGAAAGSSMRQAR